MQILLAIFARAAVLEAGSAWPRFRGPEGNGNAGAAALPVTWDESTNIRWKTPVRGKGWSSPVIWGEQIWLTTATEDGTRREAICLDRRTGEVRQDLVVIEDLLPQYCHPMNSYASPTPAVEDGRVYVHFGSAGTAAIDTATGKILWKRTDFACDHHRGPASSPVVWGDLVFLCFDGYDVQYMVALDTHTGQTVWRKDRNLDDGKTDGDMLKAYGTPSLVEVGGRPQLVSAAAQGTIAYDPATGDELWRVYHGGMNAAAPPIWSDGRWVISTGDGGMRLLSLRGDGSGDVTRTHVMWKYEQAAPSRCGPLVHKGLVFFTNEMGIVSCVDADSGEKVWQKRVGGNFSASPLLAADRIYLFDEAGKCTVIAADRKFSQVASNHLADGCMASAAVDGRALVVRTKTHVYRIEDTASP